MIANILLNGVEATGAGSAFNVPVPFHNAPGGVPNIVPSQHNVQVTFTTTGGVTALTVALEGSIDKVNFVSLVSHAFTAGELTAKTALFTVSAIGVHQVRANITTLTETGTTAVFVYHLPGI